MDKQQILLREYELCQNTTQHFERIIWRTSAAIGVGTLTPLVAALLTKNVDGKWGFIVIFGLLIVATCWIWWGMAKRWWDIQHAIFQRMRDIEEDLEMYQSRYVAFRDGNLDVEDTDLPEERKERLRMIPAFRRRGVQKVMRFLPWILTAAWAGYIVYSLITLGGNKNMGVVKWAGLIGIFVGGLGIGLFIGILAGGARQLAALRNSVGTLKELVKSLSDDRKPKREEDNAQVQTQMQQPSQNSANQQKGDGTT